MTRRYRMLAVAPVLLLLAGCAEQRQMPQLQTEVAQLNQKLQALTDRATALERQNALNAHSAAGVYLLPAAQNQALLDSAIGRISVTLSQPTVLHIRAVDTAALPAFRAQLDWGPLDPVSGKPLTGDSHTQTITAPQGLTPQQEALIPLQLPGTTPEQLGFVRLYHVEAIRP